MNQKTKSMGAQSTAPSISPEKALARFQRLLNEIPKVGAEGKDCPLFTNWVQDVQVVVSEFYGQSSMQLDQFKRIHYIPSSYHPRSPNSIFIDARLHGLKVAEGFLKSRIADLKEDLQDSPEQSLVAKTNEPKSDREVFVVHGHDHGSKEAVARHLEKLGIEPIILHEQADQGRTIIEKFEHYANVSCAVVILAPDDVGAAKASPASQEQRARQNVIFEMGFFVGRLGRKHTFVLVQKGVTRPSDTDGVLYISMDDDDTWRMRLVRELKAAGINVDANKALG